jgi:hypothetical protein
MQPPGAEERQSLSQILREARPGIVGGLVVVAVVAVVGRSFRSAPLPELLVVVVDVVAVAAAVWTLRARVGSRIIGGTPRPRFGSKVKRVAVAGLAVLAIATAAVFASSGAAEIPDLPVVFVNKTGHQVRLKTTGQAIITAPVSPAADQEVANAQVRLVDANGVIRADEIALPKGVRARVAVRVTRSERLQAMFEDGTLSLRLVFSRADAGGPFVTAGEIPFSSETFETRYVELSVNDASG